MTRTVAMDLRRHGTPTLGAADKAWLEGQPQSLWALLDTAVATSTAGRRDGVLITASRWLLANQLELIRYRLERDHDWAEAMLDAYQEKLIALVRAKTLPEADWFELVNLLKVAKVPIRPEMAEALAQAAADATPGVAPSPQDIPRELRGIVDELGRSAEDPFMVVEGLAETGTLMPPELRAYLTLRARSVVACSAARGSAAVAPGSRAGGTPSGGSGARAGRRSAHVLSGDATADLAVAQLGAGGRARSD